MKLRSSPRRGWLGPAAGLLLLASLGQAQVTISPATLPDGVTGFLYAALVQIENAESGYVWSISAGALPPGLGFAIDFAAPLNILTGIPTQAGTFNFTIKAVNEDDGSSATRAYTIRVAGGAALSVATAGLPDGSVGTAYNFVISASGGQPPYLFNSAGALPPGLTLSPLGVLSGTPSQTGNFNLTINVTDTMGGTAARVLALRIGASGVFPFSVNPQSLSFTGVSGGEPTSPQTLTVGVTVAFTIAVDDGPGGPTPAWISVSPTSGTAPALVSVTASPGSLAPGVYNARIHVIPATTEAPVTVGVTFTVTAGTQKLETSPGFLRFSTRVSAAEVDEEEIVVRNSGGGAPIAFQASVSGGSPWLSVAPSSGQTSPTTPVAVKVRANTAGLAEGNYTDSVRISSAAGNFDIAVSLFVASDGPILELSESGLHLVERQGAGNTNTETVEVFNDGDPAATINWTATVTGTPNFLSITPSSGRATASTPGEITVGLNAAASQLPPGAYYALVTVTAPNAQDSPQTFSVVLEVQPDTTAPEPELDPGGLLFVAPAAGTAPPAQKITIYDSSATPVSFQASASTKDGGKWLAISPATGTSSTAVPGVLNVSVNPAGLKAGVFVGEVDVNLNGVLRSASISLVVLPAASEARAATGCTGSRTVITPVGLPGNFSLPSAWPETLAVLLTDDCGTPLPNGIGSVVARFDNGDVPITLNDFQKTGSYSADWTPRFPSGNVTITFAASAGSLQASTAQLGGGVNKNALAPPVLFDNGTVNNTNPLAGARVAPGTVAAIYGQNLASATVSPGLLPLPTQFSGTSVIIGGVSAPLYFLSSGQLNIQIPAELKPNQHYEVAVSVNGAYAVLPGGLTVIPSTPGVSSFPDGRLIAQHSDFTLVDDARPARPGESLVMYLSGMGPTNPPVATNVQSPLSPLAQVVTQPIVTIAGENATVLFAGLTPGGIGLYQINFTVPSTARSGDLEVVIKQGNVVANSTRLKVAQ